MNSPYTSRLHCSVPECHSYGSDPEVSIYPFPKDKKLRDLWKAAIKPDKPTTRTLTVCNKHFEKSDFISGLGLATRAKHQRFRLKRNAVPSRNIPDQSVVNLPKVVNEPKLVDSSTISLADNDDTMLIDEQSSVKLDPALSEEQNITIPSKDMLPDHMPIDEPPLPELDRASSGDQNIPTTKNNVLPDSMPIHGTSLELIHALSGGSEDQNTTISNRQDLPDPMPVDETPLDLDPNLSGDQNITSNEDVLNNDLELRPLNLNPALFEPENIPITDNEDMLPGPKLIDEPPLELDPDLSGDQNITDNEDVLTNDAQLPPLKLDPPLSEAEYIPITSSSDSVNKPPLELDPVLSAECEDQKMPTITDSTEVLSDTRAISESPLELDLVLSGDEDTPSIADNTEPFMPIDEPSFELDSALSGDGHLRIDNKDVSIDKQSLEPDADFVDQPIADNKNMLVDEPPASSSIKIDAPLAQDVLLLADNEGKFSDPMPFDEIPSDSTAFVEQDIPAANKAMCSDEVVPATESSGIIENDSTSFVGRNISPTNNENTIFEPIPADDESSAIEVPDSPAFVDQNIPSIDNFSEPMSDEPPPIDPDPTAFVDQNLTSSPQHLPKKRLIDQISQTDPFKGPIPVNFMDNLVAYDYQLTCFTGISRQTLEIFTKAVYDYTKLPASPAINRKVISAMVKLKTNLSFQCLSILFHQDLTTCKIDFAETVSVLGTALKRFVCWPGKREVFANVPICLNKHSSASVMLECMEIFIEKPKYVGKIKTYSSRHNREVSVKFLVAFTPAGLVCYVSPAYGGKNSEESIFFKENLLAKLDPFDAIMVDDGFYVEDECDRKRVAVLRAPVVTEKMSKQEREVVEEFENMKAHVKKTIENMRLFNVFSCRISKDLVPCMSDVATIIGAAINVELKQKRV